MDDIKAIASTSLQHHFEFIVVIQLPKSPTKQFEEPIL